jgi:hypothetical protein
MVKRPISQAILWTIVVTIALGSLACSSKKTKEAQNEVRWDYGSFLITKNVNLADIYSTVCQVLITENIPSFTTQLKDRYTIETEWMAIRRARDPFGSTIPHFPPPPDTRFPTYIKYYIDIDIKGYKMSAASNSRGIQWASNDQSHQPNVYTDVIPGSEYWDAVIRLTQQINASLKNRIDNGQYGEFFVGPGSDRPFYSDSGNPAQTPARTYPEVPRNFNNYGDDSSWTPLNGEQVGADRR